MKDYLKMTLIVAMTIPMLLLLPSCDKNDEQKEETTTYKGSSKLTYNVYDDFLSVANIEVSYYDENGELRSEPITTAEWKKEIKYKKMPTKAGFQITCKVKNPLPKNKIFNIGYKYNGSINLLKEKTDEVIAFKSLAGMLNLGGIEAENIEKILKTFKVKEFYQIDNEKITAID